MNLLPDQIKYDPSSKAAAEFQIITEAMNELAAARRRYPTWPTDIVHATVIMVEESTEALKAANEVRWHHKNSSAATVREEVIQTIAMCLRLITETPGLIDAFPPSAGQPE